MGAQPAVSRGLVSLEEEGLQLAPGHPAGAFENSEIVFIELEHLSDCFPDQLVACLVQEAGHGGIDLQQSGIYRSVLALDQLGQQETLLHGIE